MEERGRKDESANLVLPPTHTPDKDQITKLGDLSEEESEDIKQRVLIMFANKGGKRDWWRCSISRTNMSMRRASEKKRSG